MTSFNWIDYTIISIIAISVLISTMRGFVREIISLIIWVSAIVVSFVFYQHIANLLINVIHSDTIRLIVSFIGLFLATLVLGMLVNYLISQLVSKTGLSGTDRMLGVIFGIVRGVIIAALLMMLSDLTPFTKEKSWRKSLLVPHIKPLENWLNQFLPDSISSHSGGSEPIA